MPLNTFARRFSPPSLASLLAGAAGRGRLRLRLRLRPLTTQAASNEAGNGGYAEPPDSARVPLRTAMAGGVFKMSFARAGRCYPSTSTPGPFVPSVPAGIRTNKGPASSGLLRPSELADRTNTGFASVLCLARNPNVRRQWPPTVGHGGATLKCRAMTPFLVHIEAVECKNISRTRLITDYS